MLSVKQGGIEYNFLSFWYDSSWDSNPVSQAFGEHSNYSANELVTSVLLGIHVMFDRWAIYAYIKCSATDFNYRYTKSIVYTQKQ